MRRPKAGREYEEDVSDHRAASRRGTGKRCYVQITGSPFVAGRLHAFRVTVHRHQYVHQGTNRLSSRIVAIASTIVVLVTACDRRHSGTKSRDSSKNQSSDALAATSAPTPQEPPYTPRQLEAFGRATGFVEIDGAAPPDTVLQPPSDQVACGLAFTRRGIERRGNRAAGVVVWIDGLRSGKPLPIERRFEIANDRCMLVPEVQTAIAGGTLNVQNLDATEHRTRITQTRRRRGRRDDPGDRRRAGRAERACAREAGRFSCFRVSSMPGRTRGSPCSTIRTSRRPVRTARSRSTRCRRARYQAPRVAPTTRRGRTRA